MRRGGLTSVVQQPTALDRQPPLASATRSASAVISAHVSGVRHGSARQVAGLSFSATSSEGRVKQFESQLVIELKLTTIALSMASVCARPLQTGSSVAVCASRLMPLGDCELGGERLGLVGELELGLVGVGE